MSKPLNFLLPLLLAFALTSCGGGDKYPRSTPEELGESLLQVIKNKDKEGLRTLMPTKDDLLASMEELDMTDEEKAKSREGMERNWPKVEANMENDVFGEFGPLVSDLDRKLDLATLELKQIRVALDQEEGQFLSGDITVEYTSGGGDGVFYMEECAKLESGWVMSPDGFEVE